MEATGMAHALIRAAFGSSADLVNVSALARQVGVPKQRLHGYWHGRFPWPADVALRVLAASGRMRLDDGALIIQADVPADLVGILEEQDGTRKRRRKGRGSIA